MGRQNLENFWNGIVSVLTLKYHQIDRILSELNLMKFLIFEPISPLAKKEGATISPRRGFFVNCFTQVNENSFRHTVGSNFLLDVCCYKHQTAVSRFLATQISRGRCWRRYIQSRTSTKPNVKRLVSHVCIRITNFRDLLF